MVELYREQSMVLGPIIDRVSRTLNRMRARTELDEVQAVQPQCSDELGTENEMAFKCDWIRTDSPTPRTPQHKGMNTPP